MAGVDHHDHEQIVELTRVSTRFTADVIVAALEARGIKATAEHGDAGGWYLSLGPRHRVLVFEGDVETARALLAQEGLTAEDLAEFEEEQ